LEDLLVKKLLFKNAKSEGYGPLFWRNLGTEPKFWASIMSFVWNLELFVGIVGNSQCLSGTYFFWPMILLECTEVFWCTHVYFCVVDSVMTPHIRSSLRSKIARMLSMFTALTSPVSSCLQPVARWLPACGATMQDSGSEVELPVTHSLTHSLSVL